MSAPSVNGPVPSGTVVLSGEGDDGAFTTLVAQLLFGRAGSTWQVVTAGA